MDMRVNIAGVEWKNPVTVASGTFGSGEEFSEFVDLNKLGAITTKGVADVPWAGNPTPRVAEVYGGMMNAIGLQNPGLDTFLTRDIPPTPKAEFKVYSDEELKRLNAAIVKMDEQTARLMVIHQMLGTRISDTLTLETDCLYEKGIDTIIRIRQMKTSTYEKPVSAELAALIRKAIAYTQERFGETQYIFVNENNPNKPMQYGTIQSRIVKMIREQNIRDDNGNLFIGR